MNNFNKDLEFGQKGETNIINFIENLGLTFIDYSINIEKDNDNWKYYDLLFKSGNNQIRFEVKTDRWVTEDKDSGNIPIEISCRMKPSGIKTTISDVWIYVFANLEKDNVWMIKTNNLKQLLDQEQFHAAYGGDNNTALMMLIPREQYREYFSVFTK